MKGTGQQETEEYLYSQTCNPQLLEQFAKVGVVTLGLGSVATGVVRGPRGLTLVGHRSRPNLLTTVGTARRTEVTFRPTRSDPRSAYEEARRRGTKGRSHMSKAELERAVGRR